MMRTINSLLGKQRQPALIVSDSRSVIFSNRFARQVIEKSKNLKIQGDKFTNTKPDCNSEFKKILKLSGEESVSNTIYWNDPSFRLPIRLDVLPVLDNFDHIDTAESLFIILLEAYDFCDIDLNSQFKDRYGLTPTEIELVKVLMRGLTLKQIAAQKGRATSTIKWTLANVYEKTGTRSQRQLVSLADLFVG